MTDRVDGALHGASTLPGVIQGNDDELLAACKAMHNAMDIMFAMLMTRASLAEPFLPSHHPEIWRALVQGYNAIACADPAWAHKRRQSGI